MIQFHTPPRGQGQIITVSYAATPDGVVRKAFDASDRTETYAIARWTRALERWYESSGPWNTDPPAARWRALGRAELQRLLDESGAEAPRSKMRAARAPRSRRGKPRVVAVEKWVAERFRTGQDVAMISNPANMGHVVGFDPDGSVMVQWSGGRAVSGVDPRNLRAIGRGYAGRRASEARPLPGRRHAREGSAPSKDDIDEMFDAYVETALWSSTAEDDTPLDSLDAELADSALDSMRKDVESFARENAHLIESADVTTHQYGRWGRAGHDFWLTRNGHGAGFWDGDWEPEATAERLTDAAHAYGETYLYVGDDGMIYSD